MIKARVRHPQYGLLSHKETIFFRKKKKKNHMPNNQSEGASSLQGTPGNVE